MRKLNRSGVSASLRRVSVAPAALISSLVLFCFTGSLAARDPVVGKKGAKTLDAAHRAAEPSVPATSAITTNTAAQPTPEETRLQELLKLQFDRRPQSILQALARTAQGGEAATNEVRQFQAEVVSGNWTAVGEFLGRLPEKQGPQVYRYMLGALLRTPPPGGPIPNASGEMEMPPGGMQPPGMPGMQPAPVLLPEDVLALAGISPGELGDEEVGALGRLLSRALSKGNFIDPFLERLQEGVGNLGGNDPKKRQLAVKLLIAANRLTDAGRFLPSLEMAIQNQDVPALDLHARYLLAIGRDRQETGSLRGAWELTQTILADRREDSVKEREAALTRALELMPLISKNLGTNWLRESFQSRPEQGLSIVAGMAALVSQASVSRDVENRRRSLQSQRLIVDELLAASGTNKAAWQSALDVLALNWLQEAEFSKRFPPRRNMNPQGYDFYGNASYGGYNPGQPQNPNEPPPIPPEQILPTAPSEGWIAVLEPSLAPRVRVAMAELWIKAEEEEKALPLIEEVAKVQPKAALTLGNDLLRSWARSRDPNQQQNLYGPRYNYNPYGYGYNPQGTPLTRAMQVRNIRELSGLLKRLESFGIGDLDEKALVGAFSSGHSQAEVFRIEDVESVFGPVDRMPVPILAEILQSMRQRLAGQWRAPQVQQAAKTKRNDKEIEKEVTRGYELIASLIEAALGKQPRDWRLHLARGASLYDWAEFDYGRKVDLAVYTEKRDRAFGSFEQAAGLYAETLGGIEEKDQTPLVFQQWFNANLGASDLAFITRQQEPGTNQLARIRNAILALPGEAADRHLSAFGKGLNESANGLKPELKPRYLRAGLSIVADHESASEARKLVAYYDDLLGEITLDVRPDGDAIVGHTQAFGVFVSLRHSEGVGRETGGFGRYLQNQQNMNFYFNPYGQPPVNYRDDFEKQIREKFGEGFEIISVTFNDDKVQPRGYGRPGWRETVLAYVALKAKDASVDKIPALRMDLDFFDRRGQVILPVESQVQLIDARPDTVQPRPLDKLEILEILDDRELRQGKLAVELKATGRGIVPEFKALFELNVPGFKVDTIEDQGMSFSKIDSESDDPAALCERNWMVRLRTDGAALPPRFQFPKSRIPDADVKYKRYADADLLEVQPQVALAGFALKPEHWWKWPLWIGLPALLLAGFFWRFRGGSGAADDETRPYILPAEVTPFTVLNLLRRMEGDSELPLGDSRRADLARTIAELERHFFGRNGTNGSTVQLERIAREWVQHAGDESRTRTRPVAGAAR